jgi:hypothetical protein
LAPALLAPVHFYAAIGAFGLTFSQGENAIDTERQKIVFRVKGCLP